MTLIKIGYPIDWVIKENDFLNHKNNAVNLINYSKNFHIFKFIHLKKMDISMDLSYIRSRKSIDL